MLDNLVVFYQLLKETITGAKWIFFLSKIKGGLDLQLLEVSICTFLYCIIKKIIALVQT